MKRCDLNWKDMLAVVIALASLFGVLWMLLAEGNIIPGLYPYYDKVLPGLQKYSFALGVVLLAASVSYILLGRENDIATSLEEPDK